MATTRVLVLACLVLTACIVSDSEAAVSCNVVMNDLFPCVSYVAQGGTVSANCCNGIRSLYGQAQTGPDRQSVCRCLKSALSGVTYSAFNLNNAATLPSKCGINLPYKISPSTDCDTIN